MTDQITTKPGAKYASIKLPRVYEALRREGYSKSSAARISNAQARKRKRTKAAPCMDCVLASLKGEQIAPGITRIHGDLCNVHGRYGSCSQATGGKRPAKPKKGRKPRKAPKLRQTPEQRAQARAAEQAQNRADVLSKLGIAPDGQEALEALRSGQQPDPAALARGGFVKAGLVEQAEDGSYRLTASGRAVLAAASSGDVGRAGDTISSARDRTSARTTRQEAAAKRRADAAAKRAAAAKKKPKKASGGGGGSSGVTTGDQLARQRQRDEERQADRARRLEEHAADRAQRQREHDEDRAQRLRERAEDRQAQLDARRSRAGTRVRSSRAPIAMPHNPRTTRKAYTPTRTTDAGHTGATVALFPDQAAAQAIAAADGVTEPIDQLHLTLCFLGDSTEQPLATNKDKLIEAIQQWAVEKGQSLNGTINGLGRFFHSESDDTNAVYVAPDVPGLPELRQSLAEWIEASGFDYSHDHGFTPHITVAYVPLDAPTPPIRVETPVTFDHVTLAWGDEHYDFPLGITHKSFAVFKDASGAYRWIARTTTAFEDRDDEVISTKALDGSAASVAPRGPLRWWHVGRPNPLDEAQPWGPGLDLGWCDFAALSGRTLIESGTFKSEAIARAVAAKADELELSPGFFHAAGEPDASGVFHHIRIFERSLVPKWAGRASNRYTGLVVEKTMDPKKIAALKEMGIDAATLRTLLAEVETTEKAAEAEGVRFKAEASEPTLVERFKAFLGSEQAPAAEPAPVTKAAEPVVESAPDPIATLTAQVAALTAQVAALKADAPAEEATAEEDMLVEEEPPIDDMAMEEETGGLTLSAEDLTAIGQVIGATLGPLVEALGITQKLDGHFGELKSLLGTFTATKEEQQAAATAQLDQLTAKVEELTGDAPRGAGYRPSVANDNQATLLLEALKESPDGANPGHPFADQLSQWFPNLAQPR